MYFPWALCSASVGGAGEFACRQTEARGAGYVMKWMRPRLEFKRGDRQAKFAVAGMKAGTVRSSIFVRLEHCL
jgi:hypothetical protein